MIEPQRSLSYFLKNDLYRFSSCLGYKSFFLSIIKSEGFRFVFFWRMSKSFKIINPFGFLSRLFLKHYTYKYGIQIPRTVKIGAGILIPHHGGIVLNSKSIIGANCTLMHNVTIGNTKRGSKQGTPIIGNSVYIGPGAVIVGKVKIGNNVLIAPNSYVNIDIPADSIVFGNPCVIKPDKDATKGYINNVYETNLSS